MSRFSTDDTNILFSPWVLRAAWNKVRSWGETAVWLDPAELLAWEADPWGELSRLGALLREDSWRPAPFPLVPHPKKGDQTRHFCQPSIRDQVGFAVFMVLLGPFLEARMPNVSFGNRLFRPRVLTRPAAGPSAKDEEDDGTRWFRAPYSLGQARVYESFSSGYGLFRRLLQWATNDGLLGAEQRKINEEDERDAEDPDLLPYFRKRMEGPWSGPAAQDRHLYYLRVDIGTTYPAISRQALGRTLCTMLGDDEALRGRLPAEPERWGLPAIERRNGKPGIWHTEDSRSPFPGWLESPRKGLGEHPWRRLAGDPALRLALAEQLLEALGQVEYAPWAEPAGWESEDLSGAMVTPKGDKVTPSELTKYDAAGFWRPQCSIPSEVLASQRFGLPTGLIISGLLCNAALVPLDWHFCRTYEDACRADAPRLLFLRFVDDIVLLTERAEPLFKAVQQIQGLLDDHEHLKINVEKTRPEEYREVVKRVLAGGAVPSPIELRQLPRLTRASADLFTTEMVREMSELGEEALDERYGGPGLERTERLLNLLGRSDSDEEVADAARLSFALGRLAQASWPVGSVSRGDRPPIKPEQREHLILRSAERAVRAHPARAQLWRPTLILALRTGGFGLNVLTKQILPLIAWSLALDEGDPHAWNTWEGARPAEPDLERPLPEDPAHASKVAQRRVQNRRLRTSWHRAAFWRHWLSVLLELRRRVGSPLSHPPRSGTWLSHLDLDAAKQALEKMEDVGRWLSALYPDGLGVSYWGEEGPFLWWWEADALQSALLALTPPSDDVLRWLGPPARARLHEVQGVPPGLPVSLEGHRDLRAALNRTLGPAPVRTEDTSASVPASQDGIPDLWLARLKRSESVEDTSPGADVQAPTVHGPEHVRSVAMLARVLPPERLSRWLVRLDGPLPIPTEDEQLPAEWRRVQKLALYHLYRRTLLALGHLPTWGHFEGWFTVSDIGTWPRTAVEDNLPPLLLSLLALPRDLRDEEGEVASPQLPTLCPALGVPTAISSWIVKALGKVGTPPTEDEANEKLDDEGSDENWLASLRETTEARGMTSPLIAPETVRLTANASRILRSQRVWSVAGDLHEERCAWELLPSGEPGLDPITDEYGARLAERIMDELKRATVSGGHAWVACIAPLGSLDPAPHPMFLFGRCFLDVSKRGRPDRWSMSALMLWLLTGGEHELDRLFDLAPWQPAVFDRQILRSRLLLPRNTWAWVEEGFGGEPPYLGLTGGAGREVQPRLDLPNATSVFNVRLALDRNDVLFDDDGSWQVSSLTSRPAPQERIATPERPSWAEPHDDLRVRLVQPVEGPDLRRWLDSASTPPSPLVDDAFVFRDPLRELCEQLAELRLRSRQREPAVQGATKEEDDGTRATRRRSRGPDDLALFPEWYVPHFEVSSLLQFVKETGVAVIAGLSPRELPRMTRATASLRRGGLRVLVNEALVALPALAASPSGAGRGVHAFWIRKPYPNAQEQGLALHLTEETGTPWRFQRGLTWTRFRLPTWGGFTVAICSDILDTFAWDWLRGRIQHLFVVAYNTDLDLFDKMTWTRAYELFANVAMSNHGSQGGTLSWTPKHGHHKQLFEVKGPRKGIAVTVELPIKELIEHQRNGGGQAADESKNKFWKAIHEGGTKSRPKREFKSPAPGYRPKGD